MSESTSSNAISNFYAPKKNKKCLWPLSAQCKHLTLIYSCYSKELPLASLAFLNLATSSASNLAFPYYFASFLDNKDLPFVWGLASSKKLDTKWKMIGQGSNFLLSGLFGFTRVLSFEYLQQKFEMELKNMVFRAFLMKQLGFYSVPYSGQSTTVLLEDCKTASSGITTELSSLIRYISSFTGSTISLFLISPELATFSLILVPLIGTSLGLLHFLTIKTLKKKREKEAIQSGFAQERLQNAFMLRLLGLESIMCQSYEQQLKDSKLLMRKLAFFRGMSMGVMSVIMKTCITGILFYGVQLMRSNVLTFGQLLSFGIYSAFAGLGFTGLCRSLNSFASVSVSLQKIHDAISFDHAEDLNTGMTDMSILDKSTTSISIEDVSFFYPSRPDQITLNKVSLQIRAGEIVAITGQTGVGKTTLCQLLAGLYKPSEGQIVMNDINISQLNGPMFRQKYLGVVSQEPVLFSGTIYENVLCGRKEYTEENVKSVCRLALAHEFIDTLPDQYQTRVGEQGAQLSTGQKQRIALARALLSSPKLLLLDEATSALDGDIEKKLFKSLKPFLATRTLVLVAHRETTLRLANKVVFLKDGQLFAEGAFDELLENNEFKTLLQTFPTP